MKKERLIALLSSICLSLILVALPLVGACAVAPVLPAPKSIKIGGAVPITGEYAAAGNELTFGYEQAVRDINAKGGIYVKEYNAKIPIELILRDDESDPDITEEVLDWLATERKVVAYVGSYGGELLARNAACAYWEKIPVVAAVSSLSVHQLPYRYVFSATRKTDLGVEDVFKLLNTVPEAKRPSKIALWAEDTPWGMELEWFTKRAASKYGYNIVDDEMYYSGTNVLESNPTIDFKPLIMAAKSPVLK